MSQEGATFCLYPVGFLQELNDPSCNKWRVEYRSKLLTSAPHWWWLCMPPNEKTDKMRMTLVRLVPTVGKEEKASPTRDGFLTRCFYVRECKVKTEDLFNAILYLGSQPLTSTQRAELVKKSSAFDTDLFLQVTMKNYQYMRQTFLDRTRIDSATEASESLKLRIVNPSADTA